ncbi:carbohydrate-binding module family 18 protein [Apodospora peruviana]|uniref:Carbohydrate-binding module family 18 protein n=1 Tax=Apodospora peruviana TaxID=516989 RepID=A0AAE0I541_9PEZI|nr:carbohydrate-binding module family 18 protein [Apodospora peruviana]
MWPSSLAKLVLTCVLSIATHVAADAAACTRSVKAQQGDTCASLASAAGITVAQFLKSNPSVTSCSALTSGATYCLEGTAATSSSTAPSASPTPGLRISTDGTCGNGVTCLGSSYGNCCSEHGFCGSTENYCTGECQVAFGTCGSSPGTPGTITSPPALPTTTVTVTATATTTVTRASIVLQTSTTVVTSTSTAVATRTSTVLQTLVGTAIATATVTATQTVRATVLTTSIVTLTTTSLVVATSTSVNVRTSLTTVTRTVEETSVKIETLTTIKTQTITAVNTIGCASGGGPSYFTTIWQTQTGPVIVTRTPTVTRPTVVTTVAPGRPTPYLPGSSKSCTSFDLIRENDTCRGIAQRNSVSLLEFYRLNPSVSESALNKLLCTPDLLELLLSGLCKIDCDALWPGYFVCVGT